MPFGLFYRFKYLNILPGSGYKLFLCFQQRILRIKKSEEITRFRVQIITIIIRGGEELFNVQHADGFLRN